MNLESRWVWLLTAPMGGVDGSVITKLFRGKENLSAEELLAREVIQNSWDAARVLQSEYPDEETHFSMKFRFESLSGSAKSDFIKAAGLGELALRRSSVQTGNGLEKESALSHLDSENPLHLLFLEDYGSHGLHGKVALKKWSHLFKALYLIGGTSKAKEDASQGGSYGFGKSAFVRASRINSVIAHTCFRPRDDDPVTRRLVGCTWWASHVHLKEHYEGRAFLGVGFDNDAEIVMPFDDQEADELAAHLGMPMRDPQNFNELGTTFLLVDPLVSPQDLLQAIEYHWWPALEENLMDVVVVDYSGEELIPRPAKRPDLAPYLEAFRLATGKEHISDRERQRISSKKWREKTKEGADKVETGELALIVSDQEFDEDLQGPRVALIRSPRMVIDYQQFGPRNLPIFGVYVASDQGDKLLADTEPPAHDLWDTTQSEDIEAKATKYAKLTMGRIRRSCVDFAQEFQPPVVHDGQRLNLMSSILSRFFKNNPVIPPGFVEPISIQFDDQEQLHPGADQRVYVTAGISIGLTDSSATENVVAAFECRVKVSEDEQMAGDSIPAVLEPEHDGSGFTLEEGRWIGTLEKGSITKFRLKSEEFSDDWTVIMKPMVEILGDGSRK